MGSTMIFDESRRSGALRMNMEMTGTRRMRIDITSDVICPFCLLGVKQLLIALEQYNSAHPTLPLRADIRLLPFQLNPALTDQPVDRRTYLRDKFGPRADAMSKAMADKMATMGYQFNLDGQISSSHTAHRLQMYTLQNFPHRQLALAMDVFESFHVGGIHPSDHFALADIAVRHGVFEDEDEALDWLEGDECDEDVKRSYSVARKLGIGGVPFLVFQEKYAGSGAMGIDGFTELLEEVVRREGVARGDESVIPSPTSTAASPDGQVLSKDEQLVKDSAAAAACT